jgi:asparagine N-glycosylation enzyme membrane subunit Stt3
MLTYPAYGIEKFQNFLGPFKFQQLKSEEGIEFPNVYVSVAELQGGDIRGVIQRTSAINFESAPLLILVSPFFLMIYALIYLTYSFYRKRQHLDTLILLLVWFVGPFMATVVAIRFSTLFSAPIAIGSAIILAKIINMVANKEKLED